MLRRSPSFYKQYYGALYRFFNMQRHSNLLSVDFDKPWWKLITVQKKQFTIIFIIESIREAFAIAPALFLGFCFERGRLDYFLYFISAWLLLLGVEYVSDFYATIAHLQCTQSIYYAANQRMLTIDPIHHATNEKGKIIAKIYRAADAYQEVLRLATYELLPTIIGLVTVVVSFLIIDITLGLLALASLITLCALFSVFYFITAKATLPIRVEMDDKAKTLGAESLAQIELIRATFTSDHIDQRLKSVNNKRLYHEETAWRAYFVVGTITKIFYVSAFALNGIYIFWLMRAGTVSIILGASLLITFFEGTDKLLKIGQFLYDLANNIDRVRDLFSFLKNYGHQTFPVIEPQKTSADLSANPKNTLIEVKKLKFRYNAYTTIFSGQSLLLNVPSEQPNKLYGVIGFSGQGKSTLLSILGGQLKPQQGTVKINGVNIYAVNDEQRRTLIALQKQASSSLWGTARYNITFGLPYNQSPYRDDELIDIFQRVGLWKIFSKKRGLDTTISEGGLTLSMGQRQRLNFANLYLRATYYRPAIVLIDEPTSSLDEMSEQTVTEMITELARSSVVLVVAHRIRTLEKTVGILDLSRLAQDTQLDFQTHKTLLETSAYYRQLVEGKITFDSPVNQHITPPVQPPLYDATV